MVVLYKMCLLMYLYSVMNMLPCTTVARTNELHLVFPYCTRGMVCDFLRNVIHATLKTLTVFLLKILCSLWRAGKFVSKRLRKRRAIAMFILTRFLLKRG